MKYVKLISTLFRQDSIEYIEFCYYYSFAIIFKSCSHRFFPHLHELASRFCKMLSHYHKILNRGNEILSLGNENERLNHGNETLSCGGESLNHGISCGNNRPSHGNEKLNGYHLYFFRHSLPHSFSFSLILTSYLPVTTA